MRDLVVRVLIVEVLRAYREALAEALSREPGIAVVGGAATPHDAVDLLSRSDVDVITVDPAAAGVDIIGFTREALSRWPDLGIVVLTESTEADEALEAIRIGARGWVSTSDALPQLTSALRSVGRGEVHLPADLLTRMMSAPRAPAPDPDRLRLSRLSRRQTDVLRCLMDGHNQAQVGGLLGMSPHTVRTHVRAILQRLSVRTTLSAVTLARRAGLVSGSERPMAPSNGVGALPPEADSVE